MGLSRKRLKSESGIIDQNNKFESIMNHGDEEEDLSHSTITEKPKIWGTRHTLALLGFLGFAISYAMRVNLSVAIVAMVGSNTSSSASINESVCPQLLGPMLMNSNSTSSLFSSALKPLSDPTDSGEFDWDAQQQGIVLGSFFYGYVVTQIPGGMISERMGGKWPFGIGMLVTAIFSLLTPLAARSGMGALIFVRIIQGLGEGVTNPAMHAILARWVPPLERSKFSSYVYAGAQAGTVIAMPLCGLLISSNFLGGWPSVFYVFGGLGIIWFILWTYFVYDTPSSHPRISSTELSYIQQSIGSQTAKHKVPTPWKAMLTSMPVIAILVAQTGHGWGLYTLLTELPTFMKSVLHFDLKNNSYLSALPYFTMWVVSLIVSWVADSMREASVLSTTSTRKLFNTIAHWGPALSLLGAAYAGCDRGLVVFLLTMAVGINGAHFSAFQVNHIDIAPNHAGVMMGITNGFANLCGIAAPYTAGYINKDGSSIESWRLIFLIAAGVYFVDNIFYLIFASGEEQPWNRDPAEKFESANEHTDRDPLLAEGSSSPTQPRNSSRRGYSRQE